ACHGTSARPFAGNHVGCVAGRLCHWLSACCRGLLSLLRSLLMASAFLPGPPACASLCCFCSGLRPRIRGVAEIPERQLGRAWPRHDIALEAVRLFRAAHDGAAHELPRNTGYLPHFPATCVAHVSA